MTEEALFESAVKLPVVERAAFLARECAGRPELRARLEALLVADEGQEKWLESNPTSTRAQYATMVGTVIADKYKLLEEIGEGGMGTVFVAEQFEPVKRKVAIKLIKAGMDSKSVLARFEAERQALALMDHPNIARVLDAGLTAQSRPYFVMEYIRGLPLVKYCDEARLSIGDRLELFVQVCQAVQHAHQKGIIHRDLKPGNILIALYDGKPVPKVIDFGLAKALHHSLTDRTLHTAHAMVMGTPVYMSPEQAELNNLDIDTRSDIYSLGVVLYELLTGVTPLEKQRFQAAAWAEVLRMIKEEEPSKPSTKLSQSANLPSVAAQRQIKPRKLSALLKGDLDWIAMKALEKDRNRRYETANGLAMDVRRHLCGEPVSAAPPSTGYRLRKFAKRHRPQVIAASLVFLTLLAGIIGTSTGLVWAVRERNDKAKALAAETTARQAEKQARDKALAALRAMTDDIVEYQMARSTQLTPENREFLRKIIKQFEGFAAITADDAESRAIRADGYHRVANMRHRLGEILEAESAYREALAIYQQLTADFPARPEFRRDHARCHSNLGLLLSSTGRPTEAEAAYDAALILFKQLVADSPDNSENHVNLARSQNNLGLLLTNTARVKVAESAFGESLANFRQLAAGDPNQPEYKKELAETLGNLGILLRATRRFKEAEAAYTEALAMFKQLVAFHPRRPEYRRGLAGSYGNLGILLHDMDRLKDADAAYANALVIQKKLAAEFTSRPEFPQELARTHVNRGNLYFTFERYSDAEAAFAEAVAIQKKLVADFSPHLEYGLELARSHTGMANLFNYQGRLKNAESALTDARAVQKQLASDFPKEADLQTDLAGTCVNLALLRFGRGDFQGAKTSLDDAVPHHEAALSMIPTDPATRQYYRNNLSVQVRVHASLGDHTAALETAQKLRDLGWDPPSLAVDAACAVAQCIPVIALGDPATKATRATTRAGGRRAAPAPRTGQERRHLRRPGPCAGVPRRRRVARPPCRHRRRSIARLAPRGLRRSEWPRSAGGPRPKRLRRIAGRCQRSRR